MTNNSAPLLQMQNIKKDFFGNQVLADINFTLGAGEVLGLCGENGAGKSTLMKILFGMDVIRETGGYGGDILIDGQKVEFKTPFDALEAGIGMVHQEFSLIPGFTATENILLNREPKKKNVISQVFGDRLDTLDRKEMERRSAEAIQKMGVEIDSKMIISSMPVGHKQFTEIARELSKDRLKLLILDEPTAVLTEKEAEALLSSIRSMAAQGISVIFITHRLHEWSHDKQQEQKSGDDQPGIPHLIEPIPQADRVSNLVHIFPSLYDLADHQQAELLRGRSSRQDARHPSAGNDGDAVAGLPQLLQLRGDHHYRHAALAVELLQRLQHQ